MDLHVCCNPSGFLCLLNHLYGIPNPLNYVHAPSSSVPSAVHFPSPWYIAMQDAGKLLCQNGRLIIDTLCRVQEMLRLQGHRNRAIAGRIFRMMR